jgi:predicted dehydrogenase/nucleoside-diphosphate-sugar epimerase
MTADKTRVGLIGAGYVAEHHIRALRRLPFVDLVGLTDIDPARAQAAAARFSVQRTFSSIEEMASEGVQVVHVLTPPETHARVALRAFELGCDALIEKPLATSVEDCDRMIDAAQRYGRRAGVNHSLLGDAQVRRALALFRSGRLGEPIGLELFYSSIYPPYSGGPLPVHYRDGGYPFRDLGVHAIYLVQEFLGPIQDVTTHYRTRGSDPNLLFDDWTAVMDAERGRAHVRLSWCSRPLQVYLRVHGTRGSAHADLAYLFSSARRAFPGPEIAGRVLNVFGEAATSALGLSANMTRFALKRLQPYQPLHNAVREFYERYRAGEELFSPLGAGREAVRWTELGARPADAAKRDLLGAYGARSAGATLVTGANGFLGRALVDRLLEADPDRRLRLFVRRPPAPELRSHPRVEVVLGDLGDPEAVGRAVRDCPLVFHLGAAMNGDWSSFESATVRGTGNVVDACLAHGVAKLVYVSSLSVMAAAELSGGPPVTEESALERRAGERGFYSQAKLHAETIVTEAARSRGLRVVLVRPGQILGVGTPMTSVTGAMKIGRRLVLLGRGDIQLPLVYVGDVVEGLLLAAEKGPFDGKIYQLVDEVAVRQRDLTERVAGAMELSVVRIPQLAVNGLAFGVGLLGKLLRRRVPLTPYRLRSGQADLRFDCSRAREELGWRPIVGIEEGIRRTLSALKP